MVAIDEEVKLSKTNIRCSLLPITMNNGYQNGNQATSASQKRNDSVSCVHIDSVNDIANNAGSSFRCYVVYIYIYTYMSV